MQTYISFSEDEFSIKEQILPIVKLTKSKNGETGTATFLFIKPSIFYWKGYLKYSITSMYLNWAKKKIVSNDINIFFKNGKPFLLKAVFIFTSSQEWFNFLNFMTSYSKETGLFFSEKNSFSQ